jgi:outer membrane protein
VGPTPSSARDPLVAVLLRSLLAATAMAVLAQAQTGSTLTLADAAARALKNHPQIAAAVNTAAAAGQHVIEAKSAYYPSLTADITGVQSANQQDRLGAGSLNGSRLLTRNGDGVEVDQLITDLGRTKNLVANSRLQAQASEQSTIATRYDVILHVNQAFFGVAEAGALIEVAQQTVSARQTLADQVNALYKAQLKSEIDLSFAQVNVSQAKLLLIRARDALKRAYADLARAMGEDNVVEYKLSAPNMPGEPPPDAEPLIADAVQNRPELRELKLRYQAAQKFEEAERDLKRPTLNMVGVAGTIPYLDEQPRVTPRGYEALALNVEIPIFNGHLFTARREAARYEALASDRRLRDLQQQVEHDVRGAWSSASTAYQRIPVTEELVAQAQLALKLAQGRYNLGLASIVEITQAQLALTQAQIENVNARYDYQSAFAALQYTIGALR